MMISTSNLSTALLSLHVHIKLKPREEFLTVLSDFEDDIILNSFSSIPILMYGIYSLLYISIDSISFAYDA